MSEALGASVGSVGAAVSAGPAVGASIGSSIGGEIGASGIGFEGGAPSFSGLGRSDSGLGAFSVNEGPIGPVSFSNSTDLFSETRSFVGSIGSISEGPVAGNIFSSDMQTLANSPDLGISKSQVAEKPFVFAEFQPFQAEMPVNEGPAPMPSLGEFSTVSFAPDTSFGFESKSDQEPEASIEAVVEAETAEMGIIETDIKGAVENLKENDPLTYMQLKSDLESVQTILDIVDEVTDSETAASISNIAVSAAVERSGLIQALTAPEPEQKTEADPSADPKNANVQAIMEAVNAPVEEAVVEPVQEEQPKAQYFVDEEANETRRTDTSRAIKVAFEEKADPETGVVDGKAVVDILPAEPPVEEISKIVLKEGGRNDGSEAQRRNHLSLLEFGSEEEALAANDRLIAENNAVTDEEAAKRATLAEAAKVKSGVKSSILETEVYPLAA